MTASIILTMAGLLLLGFPIMVPLLGATIVVFYLFLGNLEGTILIQQMIGGIKPSSLIAVPMFILAADIVIKGRTANRLLDFIVSLVGHLRGGLAVTTAIGCTLFGSVSGSTQATVVAIGGPMRPRMLKAGYSDSFTMALIINASDIAFMIPPSIGMIVFGVLAKTSIAELFVAGIVPGLMILLFFSIYCVLHSGKEGRGKIEKATWAERISFLKKALPGFGFPVIIIGGIYTGIFSPTEAASICVLYALILELFVSRAITYKDLSAISLSTGIVTAVIFILIAAGSAFSWVLSFAQIPQTIIGGLGLDGASHIYILSVICISFFVGCMFVDPLIALMILVPIFVPVISASGLDPVLVGTLVTLQLAIGSATPPFGIDIFTAMAIFKRPYIEVIRGTLPFISILIFVAVLIIIEPQFALFLRDLMFPK